MSLREGRRRGDRAAPCSSTLSADGIAFSVAFYGGQGGFSPESVNFSGLYWHTAPHGK
jgi:hypothetical protein